MKENVSGCFLSEHSVYPSLVYPSGQIWSLLNRILSAIVFNYSAEINKSDWLNAVPIMFFHCSAFNDSLKKNGYFVCGSLVWLVWAHIECTYSQLYKFTTITQCWCVTCRQRGVGQWNAERSLEENCRGSADILRLPSRLVSDVNVTLSNVSGSVLVLMSFGTF